MRDYEKLGVFYLGREFDVAAGEVRPEPLLYDAKDLTTHAVVVGMTGSGKTGLCLGLLEEAAIDGIPAIAIDPKGDLGNLLLSFPSLEPSDFLPWIDPGQAARAGQTKDRFAADTAKRWREGLAAWDQQPDRIARFRDAVDLAIYTPGSSAGLPLTALRSFDAPPAELRADGEWMRGRVMSAVSGLLGLLGMDTDPVRSRDHILLSTVVDRAWREGRHLDIAALIRGVQNPGFERVGVLDLESFYPSKDRAQFAMQLNNLLASPSFAGWLEGDPLDIGRLLYTSEGKPRLSIVSIAHLSDSERMFFVTILLNEILAWVRTQPGTSSLRAILYMDEVFGYFPPTANPPSKTPMLTLLKQARAYGLGVVLATQNPVDLDYKGLSNAGTWFLGRLQTERDKLRVLEGLEGASAQAGTTFDRGKMEATLAGLKSRVFLMNNVHDDEPCTFQTRWVMSYLRGPLTNAQIRSLMEDRKRAVAEGEAAVPHPAQPEAVAAPADLSQAAPTSPASPAQPPSVPAGIPVAFVAPSSSPGPGRQLVYRCGLLGRARLHFVRATYKVDTWTEAASLQNLGSSVPSPVWKGSFPCDGAIPRLETEPRPGCGFGEAPPAISRSSSFTSWSKQLKTHLYQTRDMKIWKCAALKLYSKAEETEAEFRIRLRQQAREQRDLEVEKLRRKYATKAASLKSQMETARRRIDREKDQYRRARYDSAVTFGSSILGAVLGRKVLSRTNVGKASTSMRSAGRAAQQREDIGRAKEQLAELKVKQRALEQQLEKDVQALEDEYDPSALELEPLVVRPRKSDIDLDPVTLVWLPWALGPDGIAEPLWEADPATP